MMSTRDLKLLFKFFLLSNSCLQLSLICMKAEACPSPRPPNSFKAGDHLLQLVFTPSIHLRLPTLWNEGETCCGFSCLLSFPFQACIHSHFIGTNSILNRERQRETYPKGLRSSPILADTLKSRPIWGGMNGCQPAESSPRCLPLPICTSLSSLGNCTYNQQ